MAGTVASWARREALRGAEGRTFDLLAEVLTSEQWSEWLRALLEHAARQGKRDLALKLVEAGAEIGEALHAAIERGHEDIAVDLLENGASVAAEDISRGTPLHVAARGGQPEMVQLLLLKGADVDVMDNAETTPLYEAVVNGHEAAALALMAAGADVNLRCGSSQKSVLHAATLHGYVRIMRAVIEHGADVDATDKHKFTPLHHAANISTTVEAIDVLVEAGANTEVRDDIGRTPFHYSTNNLNIDAVLAFVKHGANVNTQDDRQDTPLHWAVSHAGTGETAEVVDLLLRSGANETILNDMGKRAADVVAANAADVVAANVDEQHELADDYERVRQLLANAPADRAWRRRGYLLLCRAHPNRVQQEHASNSACAGVAGSTRGKATTERHGIDCGGGAEASPVDGRTDGNWAEVVASVVGLQEEGLFRTIVGFL